jgi:hypothetical protein
MRLLTVRAERCLFVLFAAAIPSVVWADETATASITVTAEFASRTSLKVSNQMLQFDLNDPAQPAVAVVDFSAGARTRGGGEVLLTVEPLRAIEGPGGAGDVEAGITFSGIGVGTLQGSLQNATTAIAGRWNGSGLRTGPLTFALRASVTGVYTVPVRFVLSTP